MDQLIELMMEWMRAAPSLAETGLTQAVEIRQRFAIGNMLESFIMAGVFLPVIVGGIWFSRRLFKVDDLAELSPLPLIPALVGLIFFLVNVFAALQWVSAIMAPEWYFIESVIA